MRGLAGGSPGPHLGGRLRGLAEGGCPGPQLGGGQDPHPGGPGPHLGGPGTHLGVQAQGVYPSMHCGRHPPQQTATAADGTHPTGMYEPSDLLYVQVQIF